MKLKRLAVSAAVFAVVLGLVVGGFLTNSAKAAVSNKPSINVGEFRSFVFSATTAIPYAHSSSDTAAQILVMTGENAPAAGNVLFGFSVYASTAGATAALYDAAKTLDVATAALERTKFIDEIGEATQYDTFYSDWPAPRKLVNGLVIITTNTPCVVSIYKE